MPENFGDNDYHEFVSVTADALKYVLENGVMSGEMIGFLRGPCCYDETRREMVYGLTGNYVLRIAVDLIHPDEMTNEPGMYGMHVTRERVDNPEDAGVIVQMIDVVIPDDASGIEDEK
jgi:hypothetical protein